MTFIHSFFVPIHLLFRPCILIFDSMSGSDRKVTQILRDYILCEYQSKMENAQNHTFNAKNMPGHSVKVPRQQNTSDCGLFMLHYIEQFFKVHLFQYYSLENHYFYHPKRKSLTFIFF